MLLCPCHHHQLASSSTHCVGKALPEASSAPQPGEAEYKTQPEMLKARVADEKTCAQFKPRNALQSTLRDLRRLAIVCDSATQQEVGERGDRAVWLIMWDDISARVVTTHETDQREHSRVIDRLSPPLVNVKNGITEQQLRLWHATEVDQVNTIHWTTELIRKDLNKWSSKPGLLGKASCD